MTRFLTLTLLAALAGMAALPITGPHAETRDETAGRYTLSPIDGGSGGYLRLDKETGAVSHCLMKSGVMTCAPVADAGVAGGSGASGAGDALAKLQRENETLKERVKALEAALETKAPDGPPGPPGGVPPPMPIPNEEDVDKAFDYVERMVKKLRDRIEKMDQATKPSAPGTTPSPPSGSGDAPNAAPGTEDKKAAPGSL
ncbi:MAG: hypothetical protein ACRCS9_16685 [Hyphomicrobium sp.]